MIDQQRRRPWVRRVLLSFWGKVGIALFLIACIQVAPTATIAYQYVREQMVIRRIQAVGGTVHFQSIEPKRRYRYFIDPLIWTPFYQRAKIVMLTDCDVSPDLCASLVRLKHLDWLCLEGTRVGNEQMEQVKRMISLTILDLDRTKVTDSGVKQLTPLTNLTQLFLCETSVTDQSVEMLLLHTNLLSLWVENTKISPQGVQALRKELPGCQIKPAPNAAWSFP